MKSIRILFFFVLVLLNTNCNGQPKINSAQDCRTIYNKANNKLNEYYLTNNNGCLRQLLNYTEKVSLLCPEYRTKFINLRITSLMLLQEYEKGYKFVNSLNINDFAKTYKKSMYLKTFKALSFKVQGDTIGRDNCLKEIETEIEDYISEHPSDKDAIADLFFTKIKHVNMEIVIREIELLQKKERKNVDFYEGLKETIKVMPR